MKRKKIYIILLINLTMTSCTIANNSNDSSFVDESFSSEEIISESVKSESAISVHEHSFNDEYIACDNVLHYQICQECNRKLNYDEHTYSEEKIIIDDLNIHYEKECQICHYIETRQYDDKSSNITNYLGSDGDVYRINITSDNGVFPYNKETYITGKLSITEQDTSKVIFKEKEMKAKLRGNSTSEAPKKPLKIKFESKQSLLGLEKAKNYVLLANYFDKTNIRNYLAYILANKMSNLSFQPSSIFVDLYYDNEYKGLYMLCEQMEANKGRVDVKNNMSSDGINSFMIEADARARDEYSNFPGMCYFESGGYVFGMKYPDNDDYVDSFNILYNNYPGDKEEASEFISQYEKDIRWLKRFMYNVSNSISAGYAYEKYIDVDSFVDYYIVQELFKNVDIGSTSQYYYIDQSEAGPLLHAGPVWDFDIALGVCGTDKGTYYDYVSNDLWVRTGDNYYRRLFRTDSFTTKVKERYSEIRPVLSTIYKELEIVKEYLNKAQSRDKTLWPVTYKSNTWIENFATSYYYDNLPTLQAHYDHLQKCLDERFALMDKTYLIK